MALDIEARPLAEALLAYSEATQLEIFYDGSLAIGRTSTAVKGTYTPLVGLERLLHGTGYVVRATALPGTVTVVAAAPAPAPLLAQRYEPFFAVLQSRISEALCGSEERGGEQVIFSVWIDQRGTVTRADVLGSAGSGTRRSAIATAMRGLRLGTRPPTGLPQPVTMAVFPPAPGERAGCADAAIRHAAR